MRTVLLKAIVQSKLIQGIVESRGTIRANETYRGEDGKVRIVVEENERYII